MNEQSAESYESAGVNIAAGEEAVRRITPLIEKTLRPEVLTQIGGFGGAFDITQTGRTHPVLVSSTDGVGTKAQVAMMAEKYETIGIDLVAMCVDDLICVGAEPLFFLDYISVGMLNPAQVELLVKGISDGCQEAGCALIGGEMAEHPGLMQAGEFELVGFSVGVVDKEKMISGETVIPGDAIIGLHSPGLRSNGYSLARKVFFDVAQKSINEPAWNGADVTVGEELLRPSVIYTPTILKVLEQHPIKSIAHITGGGLPGNINRVLPNNTDAEIQIGSWTPPQVFSEIQSLGNIDTDEMYKVFNMGIGMVLVIDQQSVNSTQQIIDSMGLSSSQIGTIKENGSGFVQLI
jgi:phosphoribosylformylglycinamidine cyclo-ligase